MRDVRPLNHGSDESLHATAADGTEAVRIALAVEQAAEQGKAFINPCLGDDLHGLGECRSEAEGNVDRLSGHECHFARDRLESIDLHRVDATRIFVPVTAIAVREDQLVPLGDMRAMVARLPNAELHEISSVYGHDAFLKENRHLKPIFANVLNNQDPVS